MKNSIYMLLLLMFLTGCAVTTERRTCTQYMWVPNVDVRTGINYYVDRPICVEWTKQ